MKSVKEALNIGQNWTPEQAKNDLERYVLRRELPAVKSAALAVMALEKQVPREPIWWYGSMDTVDCPCCGYGLDAVDAGESMRKHNFCPECGQALDWEAGK